MVRSTREVNLCIDQQNIKGEMGPSKLANAKKRLKVLMLQQVTTMVIEVDLGCEKCHKKIKKVLCKIPQIQNQIYDKKANTVTITVVCCSPEKIKKKICCEGGEAVKGIEIKVPEKKKPEEQPDPKRKPDRDPDPVPAPLPSKPVHVIMAMVGQHPNVTNLMEGQCTIAGVVAVVVAEVGVIMCVDVNMFVKIIPHHAQSCKGKGKGKGKAWNT
ncbi:unnamed protein product [Dovyalis caffra]|uniref:HMA domain-containing protein n=1 Tax=Dovyalis caffra TaxID=77055 RepID=A0AAV1QQP3_9ROSI|nr:unnamed protein product [Dovyalis caffra]